MASHSSDPISILDTRFELNELPRYESAEKDKAISDHIARIRLRTHSCPTRSGLCSGRLLLVLHGAVVSRIGKHSSQKKFLNVSTKVPCPHSHDRNAAEACNKSSGYCQCIVDATFQLPYHATSSKPKDKSHNFHQGLPSSVALTGTTFITEQSALSDQYLATTSCQIVYWITAQHYENHEGQVQNASFVSASRAIDAERLPSTLILKSNSAPSKPVPIARARQALGAVMTRLNLSDTVVSQLPELSVEMSNTTVQSLKSTTTATGEQYGLRLPLIFKFKFPRNDRGSNAAAMAVLRHRLRKSGLQEFAMLKASWSTCHEYRLDSAVVEQRIMKTETADIAQDINVDLPPTYFDTAEDDENHAAVVELNVSLPKNLARNTTFTSSTLRTTHTLCLDFATNKIQESTMLLLPKYSTKLEVKCQLL